MPQTHVQLRTELRAQRVSKISSAKHLRSKVTHTCTMRLHTLVINSRVGLYCACMLVLFGIRNSFGTLMLIGLTSLSAVHHFS